MSIENLTPRELDILVAEEIMGLQVIHGFIDGGELEPERYSTDIAAAWQAIELSKGGGFKIHSTWNLTTFIAEFWIGPYSGSGRWVVGEADSVPRAICLAALKAKRSL